MSRLLLLLVVGPLLLSSVLFVPLTAAFLSSTIFYSTTTTTSSFFQNKLRRAGDTTTTTASLRLKLESESESENDGSVFGGDGESETRSRSIKIRAAVFQPPISPKTKSVSSSSSSSSTTEEDDEEENNPLAILTKIADVLRVASMHNIDVVQFPEFFINGVPGVGQRGRGQSGRDNNNNNNVGLISNTLSCTTPLDRECYTLNIVGNLCAELNVACIIGYVEKKHESETTTIKNKKNKRQTTTKSTTDDDADITCYSSLAMFHADGSRAGNYRCVHPYHSTNRASLPSSSSLSSSLISDDTTSTTTPTKKKMIIGKGHPLIEIMPISLQLPIRTTAREQEKEMATSVTTTREVKIGAMCGGDILVPEHARHLARSGAEMFVVSGSFFYYNNDDNDDGNDNNNFNSYDYNTNIAKHIVPTRSIENEIPLLFSNYVDDDNDSNDDDDDDDNNNNDIDNDDAVEKTEKSDIKVEEEEASSRTRISESSFIGLSTIISRDGKELIRAPEIQYGDMPASEEGYLLPCESGGALYAADIDIDIAIDCSNDDETANTSSTRSSQLSIKQWDLTPRIIQHSDTDGSNDDDDDDDDDNHSMKTKGFGQEVKNVLRRNKKKQSKNK